MFPEGWRRIPDERIMLHLNTRLLQVSTTVLNDDGWAMPDEVEYINKLHPLNIKTCTLHTPKNLHLAETANGQYGITERHRKYTAAQAIAAGAVAIGEVGSMGTHHGTAEKTKILGKVISAPDALALDEAVYSDDDGEIKEVLKRAGLGISTAAARKLVDRRSVVPVKASNEAVREGAGDLRKLGVPALVHSTTYTADSLLRSKADRS